MSRGSSVGIAIMLRAGWSGVRIPLWVRGFSLLQKHSDRPCGLPLPEIKRAGREFDHSFASLVRVSEMSRAAPLRGRGKRYKLVLKLFIFYVYCVVMVCLYLQRGDCSWYHRCAQPINRTSSTAGTIYVCYILTGSEYIQFPVTKYYTYIVSDV